MAIWYHVVSRPCSSTKQTLNFKHFKQVSIFCFLLRHTVHMPLCLNRWGRHQNKQQNAWQAVATGIKIGCEACFYLCWWGWEGGRKMGSVPDTGWHMLLWGRRKPLSKLHTPRMLTPCLLPIWLNSLLISVATVTRLKGECLKLCSLYALHTHINSKLK